MHSEAWTGGAFEKPFATALQHLDKKGMPLARLWLVLRMFISTTLVYALATALRQPQGYWAVLTAIIVTQNSVGGSLKAAIPLGNK
jgi:uncharacterized membrane protein YccC